ncbi:SDR family oxidoreductase [Coraliomargarita akajimensis]|uniref:Short-chain dehydrogenase/reductase SDR n=1 Tax=Coraliomargarita akajimensis (strain DSM 45221 / IAM 15411 / JCM 23193 / KCTC 12865 / 04OKA010-24) TaxID=583355 RepID=D5EQJ3_CORAD|nr:SDR family oxidoreductase [Coraliomargarita akajimensis]ADE55807.1 short-chain dehydrogenase/reductase SDR [Coraliomargarita akajimensis DSM 45221]
MSKTLQDKVIVITGASSGIGEETARLLASKGARVVLGARRADRLNALVAEIEQEGGQAIALATDVSQQVDVQALVQLAVTEYGHVDVLLNNAGIMPVAPMVMTKVDDWDRMIDVNVKGLLYGIAAVLPLMKERGEGHVINVASVAGHKVIPNFTVYCATKHAVRAISEGLRAENPDIRVTTISPGLIKTELEDSTPDADIRAGVKDFYSQHAIPSSSISEAIAYAIEQPGYVDVNELVIRPTTQEL